MSVEDIIREAALRYGVDPSTLLREAQIESSLNPNASNPTSSAKGLFQFTNGTARQYGLVDPYDPYASADAGARLLRDDFQALRRGLGRDPSPAELYVAHQQGAAGALKLLTNPDAPAVSLVGNDAVALNGGRPSMTARDFVANWVSKFNRQPVSDVAAAVNPTPQPALAVNPAPRPALALNALVPAQNLSQNSAQASNQTKKTQRSLNLGQLFRDLSPNQVLPAV